MVSLPPSEIFSGPKNSTCLQHAGMLQEIKHCIFYSSCHRPIFHFSQERKCRENHWWGEDADRRRENSQGKGRGAMFPKADGRKRKVSPTFYRLSVLQSPDVCDDLNKCVHNKENTLLCASLCKVYRFLTEDQRWLTVKDEMSETPLSFSLPRQLLGVLVHEHQTRWVFLSDPVQLHPKPETHLHHL